VSDQVTVTLPNFDPLSLESTPDTGICGGETLTLWANATGGIGSRTITWSTGETTNSIQVSPTETTEYSVTVRDSCGNNITRKIKVTVLSPQAQFTYAYVDNPTIQFFDQSSEDVTQWHWFFGDGDTSSVIDPLHTYQDTGIHIVTLIVENAYGCADTIRKPVRAYPPFKYYI